MYSAGGAVENKRLAWSRVSGHMKIICLPMQLAHLVLPMLSSAFGSATWWLSVPKLGVWAGYTLPVSSICLRHSSQPIANVPKRKNDTDV